MLETKLSLSINFCINLNFGIVVPNNVPTTMTIKITAKPIIHAIDKLLVDITVINPPIAIIGA